MGKEKFHEEILYDFLFEEEDDTLPFGEMGLLHAVIDPKLTGLNLFQDMDKEEIHKMAKRMMYPDAVSAKLSGLQLKKRVRLFILDHPDRFLAFLPKGATEMLETMLLHNEPVPFSDDVAKVGMLFYSTGFAPLWEDDRIVFPSEYAALYRSYLDQEGIRGKFVDWERIAQVCKVLIRRYGIIEAELLIQMVVDYLKPLPEECCDLKPADFVQLMLDGRISSEEEDLWVFTERGKAYATCLLETDAKLALNLREQKQYANLPYLKVSQEELDWACKKGYWKDAKSTKVWSDYVGQRAWEMEEDALELRYNILSDAATCHGELNDAVERCRELFEKLEISFTAKTERLVRELYTAIPKALYKGRTEMQMQTEGRALYSDPASWADKHFESYMDDFDEYEDWEDDLEEDWDEMMSEGTLSFGEDFSDEKSNEDAESALQELRRYGKHLDLAYFISNLDPEAQDYIVNTLHMQRPRGMAQVKWEQRIANELLLKGTMRRLMLLRGEEYIQMFERVMLQEGHCALLSAEEYFTVLDECEYPYIMVTASRVGFIPEAVATVWEQIRTSEYLEECYRTGWLSFLLQMTMVYYRILPEDSIYEMYCSRPGFRIERSLFEEYLEKVCQIQSINLKRSNGLVGVRGVFEEKKSWEEYQDICRRLEPELVPWKEWEVLLKYRYPAERKTYQNLGAVLRKVTGGGKELEQELLYETFHILITPEEEDFSQRVLGRLRDRGYSLNGKEQEMVMKASMEVFGDTRTALFSGRRPKDVMENKVLSKKSGIIEAMVRALEDL